jgi:hypothetical protein
MKIKRQLRDILVLSVSKVIAKNFTVMLDSDEFSELHAWVDNFSNPVSALEAQKKHHWNF